MKKEERINGKLKRTWIDPVTKEVCETVGAIKYNYEDGKCYDETGQEVILNKNSSWVYKK